MNININLIIRKADNGGFKGYIEHIDQSLCIGHGNNELEAIKSVVDVYSNLYEVYYNEEFNKYLIWKDDLIIELRNGNKYKIVGDFGILIKRKTDSKNCVKNLYKHSFDKYLYYGVTSQHDVVKIFDENNNLLAERRHYNEIGNACVERM